MTRQRASASAQYLGSAKLSATDGELSWKSALPDSEWQPIELPAPIIIDAGSFRTGYRKLRPGDVGHLYHAEMFSGKWPPEPSENNGLDRELKPWSKAMSFLMTGKCFAGEVVNFTASSRVVMGGMDDMLDAFEDAGGGVGKAAKVKLIGTEKIRTKQGSWHAPKWEIVAIEDRDEFFAGMDICTPDQLWGEDQSGQNTGHTTEQTATKSATNDDADFF